MNLLKNLTNQISKIGSSMFSKPKTVTSNNTAELAKERLKFMMKNKNNEFVSPLSNTTNITATTTIASTPNGDISLKEQNSLEFNLNKNTNNNNNINNNNNNNINNNSNLTATTSSIPPTTSTPPTTTIASSPKQIIDLINIKGIGPITLNYLNSKGILSANDLSLISDSQCEDLKPKIKQIFNIRKEAQNIINNNK